MQWDYSAIVEIEDHDEPVFARWYDVWAGLVALDSICVADGFAGSSVSQGRLKITVDIKRNGVANLGVNLTATPQSSVENS